MIIEKTTLSDILILTPKRFGDERGFFSESWNSRILKEAGLELPEFVQDNHSFSREVGTIRGLHFQAPPHAQGKLVRCGRGSFFDVVVDIRRGSPTYGRWIGEELSFENGRQIWVPPGFLHGFLTRRPDTEIVYKCTDFYAPECEGCVYWNSPEIEIDWQFSDEPVVSEKDAAAPHFSDFESPFVWEGAA